MNKALKPGGVRILNLSQTIFQFLCCPDFTSNAFSICLDGHFNIYYRSSLGSGVIAQLQYSNFTAKFLIRLGRS